MYVSTHIYIHTYIHTYEYNKTPRHGGLRDSRCFEGLPTVPQPGGLSQTQDPSTQNPAKTLNPKPHFKQQKHPGDLNAICSAARVRSVEQFATNKAFRAAGELGRWFKGLRASGSRVLG